MIIGNFTKKGDKFNGKIATLALTANAAILLVTDKVKPEAPDYRVFVGQVEIGAGWSKTHENCGDFVSIKLDDPSFKQPINCTLFKNDENGDYRLVWERPKKNDE